jgi:hypothetical protein
MADRCRSSTAQSFVLAVTLRIVGSSFVRWLGTRLTGYGNKVWADIFDLAASTRFKVLN